MKDQNPAFHPFQHLPPEIRSIIWDMYLEEEGATLYICHSFLDLVDKPRPFTVFRRGSSTRALQTYCAIKDLDPVVELEYHPIPVNAQRCFQVNLRYTALYMSLPQSYHNQDVEETDWFLQLREDFRKLSPETPLQDAFQKLSLTAAPDGLNNRPFVDVLHNIRYLGFVVGIDHKPLGGGDRQAISQLRSVHTIFLVIQLHSIEEYAKYTPPDDKVEKRQFISLATYNASRTRYIPYIYTPYSHVKSAEKTKAEIVAALGSRAEHVRVEVMVGLPRGRFGEASRGIIDKLAFSRFSRSV